MKKNYLTQDSCSTKTKSELLLKKGLLLRVVLVCMFFSASLFSKPASVLNPHSSQETPWGASGQRNELVNKRTRTSKHFVKEGNLVSAFISPASIHYLNENNAWTDINTNIITNNGTYSQTHPYAAVENSVKTWFPSNPFTQYILMSSKEGSYREKVTAINFLDNSNQVIASLPLTGNIVANVNANKIVYTGFNQNLSLEYSLGNDGRKFDLVIHSNAFLNSVPAGAVSISIEEEFIAENNSTTIEVVNNEVNVFAQGTNVFKFVQPLAFDSNPFVDEMMSGTTSLQVNGNASIVKTKFPLIWMQDNARQFPIHLDPTVSYYPQFTTYWTGYCSTPTGKTSGQLRIASTTTAAWAKFDLSTLPPGATVTQADYYGYHYTTTGSPTKVCEMRGLGTLDPVTAAGSAIYNQAQTGGTVYNTGFNWGGTTYGWQTGTLNSAGLSDVAAAAGGDFSLGFHMTSGSTTFMYHYGINGSSTDICYLEVIYFTVPCTSVPGPNSVVTPTYAICPGAFTNLSLANSYSVGGINYQWQSSTVSPVGPFTAISGGTNAAITTATLGTQTWFNVLITCTAVAGVSTATAGTVLVQSTTTNSIPYYEGFESLPFENELPNCSWSATNLGSTSLTYTTSNTNGRVPRTGQSFASFYYSPAGTNYFYTNGLQLEAGVTYSASLWYTTEYYGYNNWTDLSILVGTSQSSPGLVPIASTNGPAISNIYKPLSGTFSVASSGIYYLAIQAMGTTNSYAYYLSWDDLEVIIPCSLNAPPLALSTNTSMVCANTPVVLTASGADTFTWSTGANGASITETPQANIIYYVVGTSTLSACSTTLSQQIQVNPSPNVLAFAAEPEICAGEPDLLSVITENGVSYAWSNNTVGPNTTVSPTSSTTYSVIGTNGFGCAASAAVAIAVNPLPVIAATSSQPNEMCVGETQVLTGTGALTYEWVSNVSFELFQGNPINISPTSTTIYTLTGTDGNGCSSKITITQSVNECTSLAENVFANVSIFPNPTSGEITFQLNESTEKTLDVTDISGKILLTTTSSQPAVKLDMTQFANGVYFVKVKSENGMKVIKVVKQ